MRLPVSESTWMVRAVGQDWRAVIMIVPLIVGLSLGLIGYVLYLLGELVHSRRPRASCAVSICVDAMGLVIFLNLIRLSILLASTQGPLASKGAAYSELDVFSVALGGLVMAALSCNQLVNTVWLAFSEATDDSHP